MNPKEIKAEIDRLDLSDKLLLVEDIWDSISANNSELPMSEWQKLELDKRCSEYQQDNPDLYDWKSAHDIIQKNH